MISAFHGLAAYRGQRNPLAVAQKLRACADAPQVCVADRPIGPIGAIFFGECQRLFDRDCWSELRDDGTREATGWYWEQELLGDIEQWEFEKFCVEHIESPRSYCEAWMSPTTLRAIWVKSWTQAPLVKCARILARNRSVPLLVLDGTCRIWDVLDAQNLPMLGVIG